MIGTVSKRGGFQGCERLDQDMRVRVSESGVPVTGRSMNSLVSRVHSFLAYFVRSPIKIVLNW